MSRKHHKPTEWARWKRRFGNLFTGCSVSLVELIVVAGVVYACSDIVRVLYRGHKAQTLLRGKHAVTAIADVTREKAYYGNNTGEFSYKYVFTVGGQQYTGATRNSEKDPGDTILIRYYAPDPSYHNTVESLKE